MLRRKDDPFIAIRLTETEKDAGEIPVSFFFLKLSDSVRSLSRDAAFRENFY